MNYQRGPITVIVILTLRCYAGWQFLSDQCNMITPTGCYQYREQGRHECYCDAFLHKTCDQKCNHGRCSLRCSSPLQCRQQCIAGQCRPMKCDSQRCEQRCVRSGCHMECTSKICVQLCTVGGCSMSCSSGVETCIQRCSGGNCKMNCPAGVRNCSQLCQLGRCLMNCEAANCKYSCNKGYCIYKDSKHLETQSKFIDQCNDGVYGNECQQRCIEGSCRLEDVSKKYESYAQICTGKSCSFFCRKSSKCKQVCTGGDCLTTRCNSEFCVQECIAGGCQLICNAKECNQICRGGNCVMNCPPGVKKCFQSCPGGQCKLQCKAEACSPFCWGGDCKYLPDYATGLNFEGMRCYIGTGVCVQQCQRKDGCRCTDFVQQGHNFRKCNQKCIKGECALYCLSSNSCEQSCFRGGCLQMRCTSEDCTQVCRGSNCNMECTGKKCKQICATGGCNMKCTTDVESCEQSCNEADGGCVYQCFAKDCTLNVT